MGKNKKKKEKKEKKKIQYRTREQRQEEVKNVLQQMNKYNLNMTYEPIQKLMKLFKQYIDEDCDIKVSIPFPEINRTIKGKLATNVKEEVTIALINEKF
jgi:hypothetical protein